MSYFPFFVDLEGKKGLIVGGGSVALEKWQQLKKFGPKVTIVAPDIVPELWNDSELSCLKREFAPEDIQGMQFVITATDSDAVNSKVSRLCREQGILINSVDDVKNCDFIFPALVQKGKLTVGVSTSGASPYAATMVKEHLLDYLPDRTDEIMDYLASIREPAKARITNKKHRTAFFKSTAALCMYIGRPLDEEETEERLLEYQSKK